MAAASSPATYSIVFHNLNDENKGNYFHEIELIKDSLEEIQAVAMLTIKNNTPITIKLNREEIHNMVNVSLIYHKVININNNNNKNSIFSFLSNIIRTAIPERSSSQQTSLKIFIESITFVPKELIDQFDDKTPSLRIATVLPRNLTSRVTILLNKSIQ